MSRIGGETRSFWCCAVNAFQSLLENASIFFFFLSGSFPPARFRSVMSWNVPIHSRIVPSFRSARLR